MRRTFRHFTPRRPFGGTRDGSRLIDARSVTANGSPTSAFRTILAIGGDTGWYAGDRVWRLRGAVDVLLGGPGLRKGRRDPISLRVGDPVDAWRVEAIEVDRLLLLRAEMRMPGRAWLRYDVQPTPDGCAITQTAIFEPAGRLGTAYWYGIWPLHDLVFERMARALAARVDAASPGSRPGTAPP